MLGTSRGMPEYGPEGRLETGQTLFEMTEAKANHEPVRGYRSSPLGVEGNVTAKWLFSQPGSPAPGFVAGVEVKATLMELGRGYRNWRTALYI